MPKGTAKKAFWFEEPISKNPGPGQLQFLVSKMLSDLVPSGGILCLEDWVLYGDVRLCVGHQ